MITVTNTRTGKTRTMTEDEYNSSEVYKNSRSWVVVNRTEETPQPAKPVAPAKAKATEPAEQNKP